MNCVQPNSVVALIDAGRDLCGTDAELARQLGMARQSLHNIRRGKEGLTPENAARLGLLVGVDPKTVLALDAIERQRDPEKAGWLRRAFFTAAGLGVACSLQLHSETTIARDYVLEQLNIHCRALLLMLRRAFGDAFGPGSMAAPLKPGYRFQPCG